jgi:RNA polymerase sigma factor (sigma-70 family)
VSTDRATPAVLAEVQQSRQRFLALVSEVRPELHRYAARMTGSIADGEDIVQDTLARAYYELAELDELPALRAWLFRIAHNRAIDFLRRYERRMSDPLETAMDVADDDSLDPSDSPLHEEALHLAIARYLEIAPAQRGCVILKDLLGYSLEEIAAMLELSVPAVKAALHRGRTRLHELATAPGRRDEAPRKTSPALARYAALFNARDWDGVRALLIDDVKLDLVSREKRTGRREVAHYFHNYDKAGDWRVAPAWLDGREVLAVFRAPDDARPGYFIELTFTDDRVAAIKDYRYVAYIDQDAKFELAEPSGGAGSPLA